MISSEGVILAGHGVVQACIREGFATIPVIRVPVRHDSPQALKILTGDNEMGALATSDDAKLAEILAAIHEQAPDDGLSGTGFDPNLLALLDGATRPVAGLHGALAAATASSSTATTKPSEWATIPLAERFVVPPFSVLDARQGYWQERKAEWKALGLVSSEGRADALTYKAGDTDAGRKIMAVNPTSAFDPVLCELALRWFSPRGANVLDPFAGGAVRGAVSALLGREYLGIDLSAKQIAANEATWEPLKSRAEAQADWVQGDALDVAKIAGGRRFDMLLSCPPYFDLEQYSDDPRDLSAMKYEAFAEAYKAIIAASCSLLEPDRFAVWVVGHVRASGGGYRPFVDDTRQAFADAGLTLYNEAVMATALGTVGLRAAKPFVATRKLAPCHQYVMVFVKGDPKAATKACGDVEVVMPETVDAAPTS